MSEEKLLSIIVPIYNEEKTIKEVLTSLIKLKETVQSIEIIVVNDGSTDATLEILKSINSDKIKKVLGFQPKYTIEDAVKELCDSFKEGLIKNSFDDEIFYNI